MNIKDENKKVAIIVIGIVSIITCFTIVTPVLGLFVIGKIMGVEYND